MDRHHGRLMLRQVSSRAQWVVMLAMICAGATASTAVAAVAQAPHVKVTYDGVDEKQASAVAQTLSAARQVYVEHFGFAMPETITCTIACGPKEATRLYTDGNDRVFLSIPSKDKLAKPATSGTFNLYGLCHEVGHIAMYRILKDRDWMTTAAAEGWAHYAGSVVVDEVYKTQGDKLWAHDPYDYRPDGTARLTKQLAAAKPSDIARGAGQWQELEKIVGRRKFPALFTAWQEGKIDPGKPDELASVLGKLHADKKPAIEAWWKSAGPILAEKRQASGFARAELPANKLLGQPVTLAGDDGTPDGKKSTAGSGHAKKFAVPGEGDWYLRSVSVHGARYGPAKAPATDFELVLCDAELKPIATWKKPYGAFARSEAWVRLEVPPTRTPKEFAVCVVFNPTASSGVFVGFDNSSKGHSLSGIPGKSSRPFADGDWMIRVELDRPKEADALKGDAAR